jgi:hypothetical protein
MSGVSTHNLLDAEVSADVKALAMAFCRPRAELDIVNARLSDIVEDRTKAPAGIAPFVRYGVPAMASFTGPKAGATRFLVCDFAINPTLPSAAMEH